MEAFFDGCFIGMSLKGPRMFLKVFSFLSHHHLHQLQVKPSPAPLPPLDPRMNASLETRGSTLPVPAQLPDQPHFQLAHHHP